MHPKNHHRAATAAAALLLANLGLSSWPTAGQAQATASSASGQASAAQVVLLGLLGTATSSSLASTGLTGTNAESDVGQLTGSIPLVLSTGVLNAATYSYADEVDSMASMGNVGLTLAGVTIAADSVAAEASQVLGGAGVGSTYIDNLVINGMPVAVTGSPNQLIAIPGGQIVLNEQAISSTGSTVVNAMHVTLNGIADVVLASARASIS